ncbi:MAG TPA: hypothetical protein VI215_09770 [Bacteroidota bacterium]|jgi:hypothetical protein
MNYLLMLNELTELAKQLALEVRFEKGDFDGGYCILKSQKVLVVNKRLSDPRKASCLAQALAEFGIETAFVKPSLREFIEDEVTRSSKPKLYS